jgi:hypothetical protein
VGHKTLKRVPLDFAWPVGRPWEGYADPHYRACPGPGCRSGRTSAGEVLMKMVRLILRAGEGAARGAAPHPRLRELGVEDVSADMIYLTSALAGRLPGLFGHDECDAHAAARKIVAAAGLAETWGLCEVCGGHGDDPAAREASESWQPTEPPAGPGWQLWDASGGDCPLSPVFATAEDLATWCERYATTVVGRRATRLQWLSMFSTEDGTEAGTSLVGSRGRLVAAVELYDLKTT